MWLTAPEVSDALCCPAEAFAGVLEQREPSAGWRGGALASLWPLAPGALHDVTGPYPPNRASGGTRFRVARSWLDNDETWYLRDGGSQPPVRAELVRRLARPQRIGEARDALVNVLSERGNRGTLAATWSGFREDPHNTANLRAEIVEGRDMAAERAARDAQLLAEYPARPRGAITSARNFTMSRGEDSGA